MKLKAATIGALLLLSILVISTVPSIGISTVSANYGSAVFCPNRYIPYPDPPGDTENEIVLSTQACYYIAGYLWEHYYPPGPCYFLFGDPLWGQYSPVVPESYTIILDNLQDGSDAITFFSKGHCSPWGSEDNYWPWGVGDHYQLLCTFEPTAAQDAVHIWPATDQG